MTRHIDDYMAGRISASEYVRRVRRDTDEMVARIRESTERQNKRADEARTRIDRARRLLRRWSS